MTSVMSAGFSRAPGRSHRAPTRASAGIPAQAGDANWKVVGAANYGGDSAPLVPWNDLLWRNETSGRLVVWQMNDQGQRIAGLFTTPAAPGDALGWHVVGPR